MEGLVSLLIIAGLFYVMMRFGCGAHNVHGQNKHGKEEVKNDINPVCGMTIDLTQGYGKIYSRQS